MSETPIQTVLAALERYTGRSAKQTGPQQWEACCPVHDDQNPSLSIGVGEDGHVLLDCKANCRTEDIVAEIGLKMADLFSRRNGKTDAIDSLARLRGWKKSALISLGCIADGQVVKFPMRSADGKITG